MPPSVPSERSASRAEDKRRAAFEQQQRSLNRRRNLVGALVVVPLAGFLGCGAGITALCAVPVEWYLAIWAALFGSFAGITIRMILERRRFDRSR